MQYVQYGCGFSAPAGWRNFDASPTLRFERLPVLGRLYTRNATRFPRAVEYGDIVAGLPLAPDSCAGMYASHVLEHLAHDDAQRALANTFRYLAPGGVFRLVVPDLRRAAADYLAHDDAEAAARFLDTVALGRRRQPRGLRARLTAWLGNSAHWWMWDEAAMTAALATHGFVAIRRCAFGDAADPRFADVEEESRFDGALAMEARKPAAGG